MLISLWIVLPLLAVALGAVPIGIVVHNGTAALPTFAIVLACASAALLSGLRWERFAP